MDYLLSGFVTNLKIWHQLGHTTQSPKEHTKAIKVIEWLHIVPQHSGQQNHFAFTLTCSLPQILTAPQF